MKLMGSLPGLSPSVRGTDIGLKYPGKFNSILSSSSSKLASNGIMGWFPWPSSTGSASSGCWAIVLSAPKCDGPGKSVDAA